MENSVNLGNLVHIKTGKLDANAAVENGKYPFFTTAKEISRIDRYSYDDEVVLVAGNGDLNVKYYQGKFDAYQRTYILTKKENAQINLKYIYYFLESYLETLRYQAIGGVIKYIKLANLTEAKLPLPNLPTQHHIATVLDHATALIEKRKAQIAELDKLAKAVFLEMFGDPETNKKCFPILYWKSIFNTTTGKLDANAMIENGKYPFFTCAKEIYYIDDYAFDCEALLLAGNNANANYDVKHYSGKFNAYQRTYVLTLNDPEHSYDFFRVSLENQLGLLKNKSIGTNTRYLTMGILSELKFIVPPIELQTLFAEKVCKIQAEKDRLQRSLVEMEQYLQSLMAKFFK